MKLKLLFKNEIIIEIIIKPERKQKLCVIVTRVFQMLITAALRSRYGHYIFILCVFFFPSLISAVADWMSTITPHMV